MFSIIPSNVKTPGAYVENDSSQASGGAAEQNALIIGLYMTGTAAGIVDTLYAVPSTGEAARLFGTGSPIYHQIQRYRQSAPSGTLYAVGASVTGGSAATGSWTVTGTATAAGTIYVYTGDRADERLAVDVAVGDSETVVATAIAAAVTADSAYLTAAGVAGLVTFTARFNSTASHDIRIKYNVLGTTGGEILPAGILIAYTTNMGELAAGAGTISIANAISAMGNVEFDWIGCGINDTTNLALLTMALNDATGRWAWNIKKYGHAFAAYQGTSSELTTFGALRDDQHMTVFGVEGQNDTGGGSFDPKSLTPSWAWGAGIMGAIATANAANAARPYKTLKAFGNIAPDPGDQFNDVERETLLDDGIATTYYSPSGGVHIQRAITTYLTDAAGQADESYLDYTTLAKLTVVNRELTSGIESKFPRAVLVDEVPAGAPSDGTFVDTVVLEGFVGGLYLGWEARGLVEDSAGFIDEMSFTRTAGNPNRVDAFLPSRITGSLLITAMLNSFRFTTS